MVLQKQLETFFKSQFSYEDGSLYWITGPKKGKKAGSVMRGGYLVINVTFSPKNSKRFLAHRIIYCMFHASMPDLIDHIDQDPTNNRIENLRKADKRVNAINTGLNSLNKSGVRGVYFQKGKWEAFGHTKESGVRRKQHLGRFKTIEDARIARENWERHNWSDI